MDRLRSITAIGMSQLTTHGCRSALLEDAGATHGCRHMPKAPSLSPLLSCDLDHPVIWNWLERVDAECNAAS